MRRVFIMILWLTINIYPLVDPHTFAFWSTRPTNAPCMLRTGQTHWPDLEEWDTLGDSGKRWAAGTVL